MDTDSTRPSLTAALVAFARAAASYPPLTRARFHDDVARDLLPAPFTWPLPRGPHASARAMQAALRVASGGLVDHLALRSLAIDDVVREGAARGIRQCVILGAGLDGRAYRMGELGETTVFEIDHPASQVAKRAKAHRLSPRAAAVVHVGVDFSRDRLGERLGASGHDPQRPSTWICEGVTMYLEEVQILALLDEVARASAPGSLLAMTYRSAGEAPFPPAFMRAVGVTLAAVGEPFREPIAPATLTRWLDERGLRSLRDESSAEWSVRYGGSAWLPRLFRSERMVVATARPIAAST